MAAERALRLATSVEEMKEAGQLDLFMAQAEVDVYVESASDEVVACRERGRHDFPSVRQAGVRFTSVDTRGRLTRRLPCETCCLATRVEKWETVGRGRNIRYVKVESHLEYHEGEKGERYLAAPGQGRMRPRQVQEALVYIALSGLSPAMVKEQAMREGKS